MAAQSYPAAISAVLKHEGGYTNHPADPGGPTNWGITIFDARKYWKPAATADDVKAMPLDVAQEIYRKRYWDAQRCDELPAGLDYSMFDYGVNSGIGRSGKVLRRLLGMPDNTSVVTAEVIAAVAKRDPAELIAAINDERLAFLKALKTWPTFGRGWGSRVSEVRALSLRLAAGGVVLPQVKKATTPAGDGGKIVAGGVGTAVIVKGVQDGWPWWAWLLVIIGVIAIGVGCYFAWRWWKRPVVSAKADYHTDATTPAATADALPTPAAIWATPSAASKPAAKRKRRSKPSAKVSKKKAA